MSLLTIVYRFRQAEIVSSFSGWSLSMEIEQTDFEIDGETLLLKPWFAVRVRSKCERMAATHLRDRGYEEFAPFCLRERRWSDRKKQIEEFLFPGYVFCRFDPQERLPVLTSPGVVDVVGFGKTPAAIPDEEVERVRRMVQSGLLVQPWPFLKLGQTVLIAQGPLTGMEGILAEVKGKCRLVVSIQLLKRSVSAEVDRDWVRPVNPLPSGPRRTTLPAVGRAS
jgi:transcription antitermination factor NusG